MQNLTASELCVIISSCRKNNVSSFSASGIRIEFNQNPEKEIRLKENSFITPEKNPEPPTLEDAKRIHQERLDELLEEAKLANPALYEEMLQYEGNLNNEDDIRPK